jgi:CheY-like chemotaxis protein
LDVIGDVPHRQVQLIIWDTGIGIAPEDQPRLFQLFVQLDSGLARQYDGCGLGLALVARITELHGGSVAVQSVKGQGSRFTITLPWHTPVADAPIIPDVDADHPHYQTVAEGSEAGLRPSPNSGLEPPVAAAPLILLAEDNEANIMTLADYLEVKGYRVVVARTGSEAITLARKVSPDMIVMDMHMPELDGLEATRRIRADAELAHIPIIAVTALAMPGDRERCLAAGANAYLSKPFSLKALVSMLAEYRATPVAT